MHGWLTHSGPTLPGFLFATFALFAVTFFLDSAWREQRTAVSTRFIQREFVMITVPVLSAPRIKTGRFQVEPPRGICELLQGLHRHD